LAEEIRGATSIKEAKQILSRITEALATGRSAFMTDGTVTRKIIMVEITNPGLAYGSESTLDVQIKDGSRKQLPIKWPWDELVEYGLADLNDGLYIAPDWWIAL